MKDNFKLKRNAVKEALFDYVSYFDSNPSIIFEQEDEYTRLIWNGNGDSNGNGKSNGNRNSSKKDKKRHSKTLPIKYKGPQISCIVLNICTAANYLILAF